jgi:predicted RNA binding protein YcfA (HicA-like mRNA interferase family)
MSRKYPPLTPREIVAILQARGFVQEHTRGSHTYYVGTVRGRRHRVTVDMAYRDFSVDRIKDIIDQSGMTRVEFYGSTKRTARKINLRAREYPTPIE